MELTWQQTEQLIFKHLKVYEENFNEMNQTDEVMFTLTQTNHKVQIEGLAADVAYLRLEKLTRPKGGKEEDWQHMLIYNQAYKFDSMKERLNPEAPWKADLYDDCLGRLIAGGLEYAELLKRTQMIQKQAAGKPLATAFGEEEKIIITDKMPTPLSDDEKKYKQWVEQNREKQ